MTSTPPSSIVKTPSTFQACSLDSLSENSSKVPIISKEKLSTIFPPPPKFTASKESIIEPTVIKTKCFSSQNILGFVLLNLLAIVAVFPLLIVNYVAYTLPDGVEFHENLIPGFNLTRLQLIGIFTFVCVDLSLYLLIYYTAYYSAAFYGCSTDLHYKIFNGSQFIPLILIVKLLQPLAVVGTDQTQCKELFGAQGREWEGVRR
uniref:Uncharacterized protein n=1 Tax=Panagrolaimus sp. JU765 TaxID=591449 RepID=A0AC34Q318_9BILA